MSGEQQMFVSALQASGRRKKGDKISATRDVVELLSAFFGDGTSKRTKFEAKLVT